MVGAKKLGMKSDPLSRCAELVIRLVRHVPSEGGCWESDTFPSPLAQDEQYSRMQAFTLPGAAHVLRCITVLECRLLHRIIRDDFA